MPITADPNPEFLLEEEVPVLDRCLVPEVRSCTYFVFTRTTGTECIAVIRLGGKESVAKACVVSFTVEEQVSSADVEVMGRRLRALLSHTPSALEGAALNSADRPLEDQHVRPEHR